MDPCHPKRRLPLHQHLLYIVPCPLPFVSLKAEAGVVFFSGAASVKFE